MDLGPSALSLSTYEHAPDWPLPSFASRGLLTMLARVSTVEPTAQRNRSVTMNANLSMLRYIAIILFVVSAILLFAKVRIDVDLGLLALGLACWAASRSGRAA